MHATHPFVARDRAATAAPKLLWLAGVIAATLLTAGFWIAFATWPASLTCRDWMDDRRTGTDHVASMSSYLTRMQFAIQVTELPDAAQFSAYVDRHCQAHPGDSVKSAIASAFETFEPDTPFP
jgi:hypothetical protein